LFHDPSLTFTRHDNRGINYDHIHSFDSRLCFMPLATNLPGQPGTTTFMHTNAVVAGPFFYRVGVRD
jgi:hypothetical protein